MHSDDEPEEDEAEEDPLYQLGKDRMVIGDRRLGKDFRRGFSGISSGSCSDMYLKKSRSSNALKTSVTQMPVTYKLGNNGANRKNRKEVVSAICEFFYYAGVPMHAANSLYFQKMLELVGQYGQGLIPEVMRGLNECIVRLEPDDVRRVSASTQISDFVSAKADFGTELAISTRTELDPEGLLDDWVVDAEKQAMPDDKQDILDHEDGYDYDILDYEDRNSDTRRCSLEMVTPAEVEPLEVHTNAGPATDDEADLDFLDDDLSD
ncbi:hypothetical protein Cgig2_011341 [Carnegiea gigantea]|uniref:Uncharacterized protein n=1 Tax=Carnegiea gigantea TaxID=171969 RepID=A0A9Q1JTW6_9CARY|nr:hypothetical protein Cgig2_011341 [Carnegiea gigantea]